MAKSVINKKNILNFCKNKKVQWTLAILVFLVILFASTSVRLSNLDTLKDSTSGKYISNDLDSLYFYRIAETKMANGGVLPPIDVLRAPGYNTTWSHEILPDVLIGLFQIEKIFSPQMTFDYSAAISAPIIFALILIAFSILTFLLTRSKTAAVLASAFLGFAPGFLFRSIAGFYDHDHLGVLAIIVFLIVFFIGLKRFEKNWKETALWGILLGFFISLVLVSWGGAITFILVLLPISFLLYYLFNINKKEKFIVFYLLWILSSIIFTVVFGSSADYMYGRFFDSQGILVMFVLGYAIIDSLLDKFKPKMKFLKEKHLHLYSLGLTILGGLVGLTLIGKNPITLFQKAWATLIYPFFGEFGSRLETTVAENAQPYLNDLISQSGKILFGLFILGLIFLAYDFVKNSKNSKNKTLATISILVLFFAVLFSRVSSSSLLNGENLLSQALYLLGGVLFLLGLGYVYSKEKFKIELETIILVAISITLVINARAAVRSFFLITPFICLIAGYGVVKIFEKYKSSKDEILRPLSLAIGLIIILLIFISFFGNPISKTNGTYQTISQQAKYVGPSANIEWQDAMAWARNNTSPSDIFVHWWDYGYFVETLANRPVVTDGGHAGGGSTDHNIGRYLLTTPNPLTAYSFMKTWNVSYLLIDPTELGKYGAFSKIGSNDSYDRISSGIFAGASDDTQMQETAKGFSKVYQMGGCVDGDIAYKDGNTNVFLPGISVSKTQQLSCNSYLGAIIIEFEFGANNVTSIKQPTGVFIYNNKQYRIPLKHLFMDGRMASFDKGIDAVAYLIPRVNEKTGKMDSVGAAIYLSPRTFNSLVGKLYVLDDYSKEYTGLKLANQQDDPAVTYFKQFTGGKLNEFIWYQGLRAPLKIWKVSYPAGTQVQEGFLSKTFTFGGMDKYF